MRRPSVKITGWLRDVVTNISVEMREHLKQDPCDRQVKRWLGHVEVAKAIAEQIVDRATQEKAHWKETKK